MKCFNCGNEGTEYLCPNCRTQAVLEKVFREIRFYKPETCENPYLAEYVLGLTEKYAERDAIPTILDCFDFKTNEFYYCQYYRMRRDDRFEDAALTYLENHSLDEIKTQNVLYDLLESYIPNDYIKPQKWCKLIAETEDLCCNLYAKAAEFLSMVGDYDLSDCVVDYALKLCDDAEKAKFLFSSAENMIVNLNKQKAKTLGYRTKTPYWPKTEERRRALSRIYDEKGLAYPRIESKPAKVPENEFTPINECFEAPEDYCAFWCAEAFSVASSKPIYQIAAVKVKSNKVVDSFQSFVRPWDANKAGRQSAAKEAGVPLSVIEGAEDVDQVMVKFFDFVGDSVLLSTGALGNQAKLLCRAARYAGMKQLPNELYELLDLAAETNSKFDLENNNREFLLRYFNISEGVDALGKAKANVSLYEALKNYGV